MNEEQFNDIWVTLKRLNQRVDTLETLMCGLNSEILEIKYQINTMEIK